MRALSRTIDAAYRLRWRAIAVLSKVVGVVLDRVRPSRRHRRWAYEIRRALMNTEAYRPRRWGDHSGYAYYTVDHDEDASARWAVANDVLRWDPNVRRGVRLVLLSANTVLPEPRPREISSIGLYR